MRSDELDKLLTNLLQNNANPQTTALCSPASDPADTLAETICAFTNQDNGGFLFFGLNPAEPHSPDPHYSRPEAQAFLSEALSGLSVSIECDTVESNSAGFPVLCAHIPATHPSMRPVYLKDRGIKEGSFYRKGSENLPMSQRDRLTYRAFSTKGAEELRPVLEASVALLKTDRVRDYLNTLREKQPETFGQTDNETMMESLGLTMGGLPTLAGYLIFSDHPQSCFPGLFIMASSIRPGEKQHGHSHPKITMKQITGSLPDMLDESVSFLLTAQKWLTEGDYPLVVVREAILNALLHRDYSRYTQTIPIQISLFPDRIEITNAGTMANSEDSDAEVLTPNNKTIANIMEALQLTGNTQSGIASMQRLCKNAGFPEPEFLQGEDSTTVILRRRKPSLKPKKNNP